MTRVIVTPEATADIDSALNWHGTRGAGLLLQFIDELDRALPVVIGSSVSQLLDWYWVRAAELRPVAHEAG